MELYGRRLSRHRPARPRPGTRRSAEARRDAACLQNSDASQMQRFVLLTLHNGSESSLESVIDFYDPGSQTQRSSVSPEIRPLHLSTAEKNNLIAFIQTLTSPDKT